MKPLANSMKILPFVNGGLRSIRHGKRTWRNPPEKLPAIKSLLPQEEFLMRLRQEKKRVDRSKAPLSVLVFFCADTGAGQGGKTRFLQYLEEVTREIDIKGVLGEDRIGLLLPDTDAAGLKGCRERIAAGNGHFPVRHVSGTYPDLLFEEILAEKIGRPDLFPLDLNEDFRPGRIAGAMKRGLDIAGSLLGLAVSSPLLLAIALVIKATSPGPVIYKQTRLGRRGERFSFYKFRTMVHCADDRIHREYVTQLIGGCLEGSNQGKEKPFYKMKSDSRVTRVGRVLRALSLDELPQFYNVLRGNMSLVGPRPPVLYEVEKYKPWHIRRVLEVKPGLTGLWQVSGRSTTTFDEMVRMDLRYVRQWSLWLDFKILLKTVREVISPRGAA